MGPEGRRDPNATMAADIQALRDAGLDDGQIFAITAFVALRLAFSMINDSLGAQPDAELAQSLPQEVREAATSRPGGRGLVYTRPAGWPAPRWRRPAAADGGITSCFAEEAPVTRPHPGTAPARARPRRTRRPPRPPARITLHRAGAGRHTCGSAGAPCSRRRRQTGSHGVSDRRRGRRRAGPARRAGGVPGS